MEVCSLATLSGWEWKTDAQMKPEKLIRKNNKYKNNFDRKKWLKLRCLGYFDFHRVLPVRWYVCSSDDRNYPNIYRLRCKQKTEYRIRVNLQLKHQFVLYLFLGLGIELKIFWAIKSHLVSLESVICVRYMYEIKRLYHKWQCNWLCLFFIE